MPQLMKSCREMCSFLGIENTFPYEVEKRYPVIANSYYLSLIDRNDLRDFLPVEVVQLIRRKITGALYRRIEG